MTVPSKILSNMKRSESIAFDQYGLKNEWAREVCRRQYWSALLGFAHKNKILYFNKTMRLQFQLAKIKIDPVCHLQLLRHADEFQQKNNIYGQLYGALLEDMTAEVTSILPLPDGQKTTKEELETMERRNDELLTNYNLDSQKIGWYLICYTRNFWDSLETIKYYENYINTSFFLTFDYKARQQGRNPYKAFRLKNEFALKDNFKWSDLQKTNLPNDNPFQQIPVEVHKTELFDLMMLFNRQSFLKKFQEDKREASTFGKIKKNIQEYMTAFEERDEIQKYFNENYLKESSKEEKEKLIPFNDYAQFIGQALKVDNYENYFKNYLSDNKKYEQLFE